MYRVRPRRSFRERHRVAGGCPGGRFRTETVWRCRRRAGINIIPKAVSERAFYLRLLPRQDEKDTCCLLAVLVFYTYINARDWMAVAGGLRIFRVDPVKDRQHPGLGMGTVIYNTVPASYSTAADGSPPTGNRFDPAKMVGPDKIHGVMDRLRATRLPPIIYTRPRLVVGFQRPRRTTRRPSTSVSRLFPLTAHQSRTRVSPRHAQH